MISDMPCDASDSFEPTIWPWPPSPSAAFSEERDFFSKLLVDELSATASFDGLFKLPVGDTPTTVPLARPLDTFRLCVDTVRPKLPVGLCVVVISERLVFSRLSDFPTLRPSSSIKSGGLNFPSSGVVFLFAASVLASKVSGDFCLKMSEGFTLRSSELPGLSDEDKLPDVLGKGILLPINGESRFGEDDSCPGIVGGSTRRIFLGGGLGGIFFLASECAAYVEADIEGDVNAGDNGGAVGSTLVETLRSKLLKVVVVVLCTDSLPSNPHSSSASILDLLSFTSITVTKCDVFCDGGFVFCANSPDDITSDSLMSSNGVWRTVSLSLPAELLPNEAANSFKH